MIADPMSASGKDIDPYASLNPQAFTDVQQQEQAQSSQIPLPSPRAMDLSALQDPYSGPGAKFNPSAIMKAGSIYGSAAQRQGIMNTNTPLEGNAFIGAMQAAKNKGEDTFTVGDKTFNVK